MHEGLGGGMEEQRMRGPERPNAFHTTTEARGTTPPGNSGEGEKEALEATRQERLNEALELLGEILRGFDEYALFGSAALQLRVPQERTLRPNDLDIVAKNEGAWREMVARFQAQARAHPDRIMMDERPFKFPGQDAQVMRGKFLFPGMGTIEETAIPFELFSEQRIAGAPEVFAHRSRINGVMALDAEGLQLQYRQNLELETRVDRATQQVLKKVVELHGPALMELGKHVLEGGSLTLEETTLARSIARDLAVQESDVQMFARFFSLLKGDLQQLFNNPAIREQLTAQFAAIKTKAEARLARLELLTNFPEFDHPAVSTEHPPAEVRQLRPQKALPTSDEGRIQLPDAA